MAVNTFSMRLGSRRNQRPPHQKIRSITTVRAMIDTIRIGHMIGSPFMKLSTRKLPVDLCSAGVAAAGEAPAVGEVPAAGAAPGLALSVAVTVESGAGEP